MSPTIAKRFAFVLCVVLSVAFLLLAPHSRAQERTGTSQQGLVTATLVSEETQQAYGLVTLDTGCSGSLLRDNWVVTAAHCVDNPDPANAGQFITVAENSVNITAVWGGGQTRPSERIITFRPNDVAIIRIANRFTGMNDGYNRGIYRDKLSPLSITVFGRGINQFATGSGATAVPSQTDGNYRIGYFKTVDESDGRYWYQGTPSLMVAGGDSGGPSYWNGPSGPLLVGVHSSCTAVTCVPGKTCGTWTGPTPAPANYRPWQWVSSTSRCGDAPLAPVWDDIDRYLGAFVAPVQFVGTFAKTPANYQPIWLYAIKNNGELVWYRKDSNATSWSGPKSVGVGWAAGFKNAIPAGGNSIYLLSDDGRLGWRRHDGFNDGSFKWTGPTEVGHGWNFSKVFSGGEGIIYAIKDDGTMLWYKHGGYADGSVQTWTGPSAVGSGWENFKDVFSNGQGQVYAVRPDGALLLYQHINYQTGARSWSEPRQVGSGWQNFRQIIPAGDGVILAITNEGKLLWYKHLGLRKPVAFARLKETWEGPIEIGSGWQNFKQVFALLPVSTPSPVR